jgi:hypothetical protein
MFDHRPIPNCYWVEPGRFLAGEYPGAPGEAEARRKLRLFLEAGVSFFLDLTQPGESPPYAPFLREEAARLKIAADYRRMSIRDFGVPPPAEMTRVLNTIDDALASGRTVYVHCWGGVGRTGTVVGCYLARRGHTGQQALDQLDRLRKAMEKAAWRVSPETDEQREFVQRWRE